MFGDKAKDILAYMWYTAIRWGATLGVIVAAITVMSMTTSSEHTSENKILYPILAFVFSIIAVFCVPLPLLVWYTFLHMIGQISHAIKRDEE